jgi:hypothetical protein
MTPLYPFRDDFQHLSAKEIIAFIRSLDYRSFLV